MDHTKTPLYERLIDHASRQPASFHVPGHKGGHGMKSKPEAYAAFGALMQIDLTEISGLDDLHHPEGVIREAQELAADAFGAEETLFLVGGSTAGNLALILALCQQDDLLIVQRNVHKSVLHGLMLARARAVFLPPGWDEATGMATGPDAAILRVALEKYPEAKGVFITNPNYYGMGVDLEPLVDMAHAYHKPILVDEAHGAHFGFHPDVPASAVAYGADGVVQSSHKMLTALTMGSMLHLQGERINRAILRNRLSMLQTSSPSYPIMASLDVCRRWMALHGRESLEKGLGAVRMFEEQMKQLPWFHCIGEGRSLAEGVTKDPFKIMIRDRTGTLNGYELQTALERFGCFSEMADPAHVLLVFSLATQKTDVVQLFHAFQAISREFALIKQELLENVTNIYKIPQFACMTPPIRLDPVFEQPVRTVPIEAAVQCYSAEMVIPYPPGIPVLYPGEIITRETIQLLKTLHASGAKWQGMKDTSFQTLQIKA